MGWKVFWVLFLNEYLTRMKFGAIDCKISKYFRNKQIFSPTTTQPKHDMKVRSQLCLYTRFRFWLSERGSKLCTFLNPLIFESQCILRQFSFVQKPVFSVLLKNNKGFCFLSKKTPKTFGLQDGGGAGGGGRFDPGIIFRNLKQKMPVGVQDFFEKVIYGGENFRKLCVFFGNL